MKTSRREFLGAAAALGLTCGTPGVFGEPAFAAGSTGAPKLDYEPNWLKREAGRSRVVDISSSSAVQASVLDPVELGELLDQGVGQLTGETRLAAAWRCVLGDARKVLLKFNSVGAAVIKTNDVLTQVLIDRLSEAGYSREMIRVAESPSYVVKRAGAETADDGWEGAIRVGDDEEPIRRYVSEAEAIINIPTLKTHQIAGMSGCLKNISHAVIRHPARYHGDRCSPYVAQVVGAKELSSKIKLNLMSALRIVVDKGPDAREEDVLNYGGLLLGYDPVSVDAIAANVLAMERRRQGLSTNLNVKYLSAAAEMDLGRWRVAEIDRVALRVGQT